MYTPLILPQANQIFYCKVAHKMQRFCSGSFWRLSLLWISLSLSPKELSLYHIELFTHILNEYRPRAMAGFRRLVWRAQCFVYSLNFECLQWSKSLQGQSLTLCCSPWWGWMLPIHFSPPPPPIHFSNLWSLQELAANFRTYNTIGPLDGNLWLCIMKLAVAPWVNKCITIFLNQFFSSYRFTITFNKMLIKNTLLNIQGSMH